MTCKASSNLTLLDCISLLRGGALVSGSAALAAWFPAWAQPVSTGIVAALPTINGPDVSLRIARQTLQIDGKPFRAIGLNGTVPAPLIRLRQGQKVRLSVSNDLDVDHLIHCHGLLVPFQYGGVPRANCRMHVQIAGGLRHFYPTLPNQLHRPDLELPAELASFQLRPPVSKTP